MARRKHSDELNIGSDSFLDVIANIVGILIILIVIAGVRVGNEPVAAKDLPVRETVKPSEPVPQLVAETPARPDPELEEPDEPEFVEQTAPPTEVATKIQAIQTEIDTLQAAVATSEADKQKLEQRQAQGELQITVGRHTLLQEKSKHEARTRSVEELQALIVSQKNNLGLLHAQLAELEKTAPQTKKLKHRVTPLSRAVAADQIHFRLSANRVSQVPIHDLLQTAMRQAKRHVDELAQNRTHMGTVGPTSGYFLQYKLEAVPQSPSEAAIYGPGAVRIALTSFQLSPDTDLQEETTEEALTRGSMFDLAMQTAEPGSTFTLWVYPDSFPLYRQLQAKLHEAGFTVAGRPLPKGIPIAGSPDGSASAGQ